MNRYLVFLLLFSLITVNVSAQKRTRKPTGKAPTRAVAMPLPQPYQETLGNAKQALVVTTPGWNNVSGTLIRYEKVGDQWRQVGENVPIVVGKSGLGWDALIELPASISDPIKKEGDGRSPAGIFPIVEAFGFDPTTPETKLPYRQLTESIECVDDPNSRSYNQIVDVKQMSHTDWDSSEKMRTIDVYKLGATVDYNHLKVAGAGSCIFLHIWKGSDRGTAGCTAMEERNLQEVVRWLDASKSPVLIQFPAPLYKQLKDSWQLP
ncbi:MAG TPA: L,D-transpeptidase family protein [Terriglobales bacterium]|nr:L,D-transpeptidase family protein [Terriglobales bacterium]